MRPSSSRSEVAAATGELAWAEAMLDFEAALAASLAALSLAPAAAAEEIAAACDAGELDLAELRRGTELDGTPVPALLAALRPRLSEEAAAHLHRGATSQDAVDTAAMLVSKRAVATTLADLDAAAAICAELAEEHRRALQVGRTLLQQAAPITFGLKAAVWLNGLDEAAERLAEVRDRVLAVQLGGAVGTLAAYGERGPELAAELASRLGLSAPALPWQANRVRPALLAGALGAAAGAAGKVGGDIVGLAQSEVAEVAAGGEGGGSSAMPHKRNPAAAVRAVSCAARAPGLVATMLAAMGGEQERAAGGWQAEAETLDELLRLTGAAAAALRAALEGLDVDPWRMHANLVRAGDLVLGEALKSALVESLGAAGAHDAVAAAAREARERGIALAEAAAASPAIAAALEKGEIAAALEPSSYLGATDELIDRALAAHRERRGGG